MFKKMRMAIFIIGVLLLATGCTNAEQHITAESTGFWMEFFVFPLSWLLIQVATLFNGSYGISIIFVTLLIRLILLPLSIKQWKSSKAMQDVQPELKKIRDTYSSKDAKTQQKLQEETMKLFQENKVNPVSGCLPLIIQIPILLAFYHAINGTEAIEESSFLWFSLGAPDPFYILPVIAMLTAFLQQILMMSGNKNVGNEQLAMQMKMMLYVMPIMIGVFSNFLPSALALYWVAGNTFVIIQMLFIKKVLEKN